MVVMTMFSFLFFLLLTLIIKLRKKKKDKQERDKKTNRRRRVSMRDRTRCRVKVNRKNRPKAQQNKAHMTTKQQVIPDRPSLQPFAVLFEDTDIHSFVSFCLSLPLSFFVRTLFFAFLCSFFLSSSYRDDGGGFSSRPLLQHLSLPRNITLRAVIHERREMRR